MDEPEAVRTEIRRRLIDDRNDVHRVSAFYELAIGEGLRRLFGNRIKDPQDLPVAGVPDYLVEIRGGRAVVEVVSPTRAPSLIERRRLAILCRVALLRGPWWTIIKWPESVGLEAEPPRKVMAAVRRLLEDLPAIPDEGVAVTSTVGVAALSMHIFPRTNIGSVVGMDETRQVRVSPGVADIRDRVGEKAHRYHGLKDSKIPFVVAVCSGDLLIDVDSVFTALFGDETIAFTLGPGQPRATQGNLSRTGILTPGRDGPRLTTVSEVWLVRRSFYRGRLGLEIIRAPNPWAANPLHWRDRRVVAIRSWVTNGGVAFRKPAGVRRLSIS